MTVGRKLIEIIDGVPHPVFQRIINPEQVDTVVLGCLMKDYEAVLTKDGEPKAGEENYDGFTKLEVMIDRISTRASQQGNVEDIRFLIERASGKPMQKTENTNVNINPLQWIRGLKKPERSPDTYKDLTPGLAFRGNVEPHDEDEPAITVDAEVIERPQKINIPRNYGSRI